jgi:glycosyltransferase involved in cell wall biosynthesis
LMRIAYLNTLYPSLSHTFIEREVRALRENGVEVHTFSVRRPGRADTLSESHRRAASETVYLVDGIWPMLMAAGLMLLRHPVRSVLGLLASQRLSSPGLKQRMRHLAYAVEAARLAREMRLRKLRHVHVHMANNGASVAMLACVLCPELTYSLTIHGSAEFFNVEPVRLKQKAENATFVRAISDFGKAQIMAWARPENWARFHVVHCGVCPSQYSPASPRAGGPLRLVTLGRLVPIKGYSLLLEACGHLSEQGVDWTLEIIGDGPMRAGLERRAHELRIGDRVRFAGAVGQDDLPRRLDEAEVMVVSSFMEGVPVVLMEAMAKELAVVATAVGGIPELVTPGSGWLVPPGSSESLAQALLEAVEHRTELRSMGRRGRQRVVDAFSTDRLGREMTALFSKYLADGDASAGPSSDSDGAPRVAWSMLPKSSRRYCLISPCRDEAAYMRRTLDSVIAQTVRPALWVIVDDGSTDGSAEILDEYAARHDFIRVVHRRDRGRRSVGPGVIDAFYAGYETIEAADYDYICKLDMDLDLPDRYFESLMEKMEAQPRLGCASGRAWYVDPASGRQMLEKISWEMSVGASKFYRRECFEDIGGLQREVMWDGIDCHRARMLGWMAGNFDGPALLFEHLRPMGSSDRGVLRGRMRHGLGQYFMGTSALYLTASAVLRLWTRPRIIGSLAMWWGYVSSAIRRRPRLDDRQFRRFLRRYQWLCLTRGKHRATELVHAERAGTWSGWRGKAPGTSAQPSIRD